MSELEKPCDQGALPLRPKASSMKATPRLNTSDFSPTGCRLSASGDIQRIGMPPLCIGVCAPSIEPPSGSVFDNP
jgi:hypothetical protein